MRRITSEISIYLLLAFMVFALVSLPVLFYDLPDVTDPEINNRPPPEPVEIGDPPDLGFITDIVQIIGILVIIFVVIQLARYFDLGNRNPLKRVEKEKIVSEKEGVRRLKDARETAYHILRQGIMDRNYTHSFILAYQTLDNELNHFREARRPKHFTPREYSFSVREPLFRPAVYLFVKPFYEIRYGMQEAHVGDLETFIFALDNLFTKDVSEKDKMQMLENLNTDLKNFKGFSIPRRVDSRRMVGGMQ